MALASSSRFLPSNMLMEALVSYSNPHNHSGSLPVPKQWKPFVAPPYCLRDVVLLSGSLCCPIWLETATSPSIHFLSPVPSQLPWWGRWSLDRSAVHDRANMERLTSTNNHTRGLSSFWTGSMEICIFFVSLSFCCFMVEIMDTNDFHSTGCVGWKMSPEPWLSQRWGVKEWNFNFEMTYPFK